MTVDAWMASLSVGALSFVQIVSAIFALIFARAVQAQALILEASRQSLKR